jgi:hypothetical protein
MRVPAAGPVLLFVACLASAASANPWSPGTPARERGIAAADPLIEARRLYNLGQYEMAEKLARDAAAIPARTDAARVVLGRIQLERYRQSADRTDFNQARESLRMVDASALDAAERVELTIGLAEALYLEKQFGAAGDLFESVVQRSSLLGTPAHERVLDWWATSLDRQAQTRQPDERAAIYQRILTRMNEEIAEHPGSTAAGYWLAAAARANGDVERAWHAAVAGWLRAILADDRGAALRADLDRLMAQAIIPERAAKLSPKDPKESQATLQAEWDAFKKAWSK